MINPGLDDIDIAAIKTSIDADVKTKKIVSKISVRKPDPLEFIRVHESWSFPCKVLIDKTEGINKEYWLFSSEVAPLVEADLTFVVFYPAINRKGNVFLIEVKESNLKNSWVSTLFEGVKTAKLYWVRLRANNSTGRYDVDAAEQDLGNPQWPESYTVVNGQGKMEDRPFSMELLIKLTFKDRYVNDPEHEVIKKIRGLV